MSELRKEHGFDAVVLHFDHGIRKDSADDAEFVRRLAGRFGLPFH
jgi:tRNA(Ile)-lysidine synthase TilS/MesJ